MKVQLFITVEDFSLCRFELEDPRLQTAAAESETLYEIRLICFLRDRPESAERVTFLVGW